MMLQKEIDIGDEVKVRKRIGEVIKIALEEKIQ